MLFQSEEVLFRPQRLLEIFAAATAGIPIVSLVCSGKGYDFVAAEDHLLHLDTSLSESNPSAVGVLEANTDAPLLRVAHVLWACIPNIISVPLNSSGSENAIRAAVADLVKAMQRAKAIPVPPDEDAWLESREARDGEALAELITSSTIRETQRGRMLQKVERADEMAEEIAELKRSLATEREKREAERAEHKVGLAGAVAKLEAKSETLEVERCEHATSLASVREKFETKIEKLEAKIEKFEEKLGY